LGLSVRQSWRCTIRVDHWQLLELTLLGSIMYVIVLSTCILLYYREVTVLIWDAIEQSAPSIAKETAPSSSRSATIQRRSPQPIRNTFIETCQIFVVIGRPICYQRRHLGLSDESMVIVEFVQQRRRRVHRATVPFIHSAYRLVELTCRLHLVECCPVKRIPVKSDCCTVSSHLVEMFDEYEKVLVRLAIRPPFLFVC
jgi:hypothetical protein